MFQRSIAATIHPVRRALSSFYHSQPLSDLPGRTHSSRLPEAGTQSGRGYYVIPASKCTVPPTTLGVRGASARR